MEAHLESLSEDPKVLKEMLAEKLVSIPIRDEEIELLRERIRLLQAKLFMPKSEQLKHLVSADQLALFDEVESKAQPAEDDEDEKEELVLKPRRKRGPKPISADIPRREILHDLSEEDKICDCGCVRTPIGEDISEELEYIPAQLEVLRHIRPRYVCKRCEKAHEPDNKPVQAPAPIRMIPGIMAGPGLLAHTITAKYADGMPFYRLSKQTRRLGLEISRATMSNWAKAIALRLTPMWHMLLEEAKTRSWLQVDETYFQVHKEEGKTNQSLSYMWVVRAGPIKKPIIVYKYDPTREARVALELLKNYQGLVQTDAYAGYNFLATHAGIHHAGDWDHVHRKFAEAVRARSKKSPGKLTYAERALRTISKLYKVEKEVRLGDQDPASIVAIRQEKARPVIEAFETWLRDLQPKTPEKSLLGKAISYTLNIWPRLLVYLEEGDLPISTTYVENSIRPFAVGRKAWLFCGSPRGAEASAVIYSFIETARANGWEPFAYLDYLFRELPKANTENDVHALLPIFPPERQVFPQLDRS